MSTHASILNTHTMGDVQVIALTRGDMTDAAYIKQVGDEIYRIIKPLEHPKIVIDFARVQRLSSATLGMLVALRKVVVVRQKGQLRVANVADNLLEIFKMTRLDNVLCLCATTEAAVESLR